MSAKHNIYTEKIEGGPNEIRIDTGDCESLYDVLGDIEFKLEQASFKLKPQTYLYKEFADQNYCQVLVHEIPDGPNEYRLGTVFLRHFYVTLDYDADIIGIGMNKDSVGLVEYDIV